MKIKKIHIENFRSIKELDLEPGSMCILVGENNSGKTNLLRALNLILGETWPTERQFNEDDFWNRDPSKAIIIRVIFDEEKEYWFNKFKLLVAGVQLTVSVYKKKTGKKTPGEIRTEFVCVDSKGKVLQYPAEPLQVGVQYKGQWYPHRVSSEIKESMPFILVDILRQYERHTPGGRWSVLRKLYSEVNVDFQRSTDEVQMINETGEKALVKRKDAFEKTVKSAYEFVKTDYYKKIEEALVRNTLEQMGLTPEEGSIRLGFKAYDPTNVYKSLELFVEQMGVEVSASEVGSGLQSAVVVGIFRTYEELKKEGAIFAIEEPEVFLHPQKARYFSEILEKLAENGNQVFVTTHSPIFVKIYRPEDVCLLRRTTQAGTYPIRKSKIEIATTTRQQLRLFTEFDAQRNELFFAKRVLLVEGTTERTIFPLIARSLGFDLNREGVSVVDCGGKTKIPLFVQIVTAFSIPFIVVVDEDIHKIETSWSTEKVKKVEENNKKHKKWNEDIVQAVGDTGNIFWLKPHLESIANLPQSEQTKVDRAIEKFSSIEKLDIPKELSDAIIFLMNIPLG